MTIGLAERYVLGGKNPFFGIPVYAFLKSDVCRHDARTKIWDEGSMDQSHSGLPFHRRISPSKVPYPFTCVLASSMTI
jgi:hypothetical protein